MYVGNMNNVVTWDGAEWKEPMKIELSFVIAKFAKEFGWGIGEILDMTLSEVGAILEHLPRVNYESAWYTALAFNDPERLTLDLEEIYDKNLTPLEKWKKGIAKMQRAAGR